MSESIFSSISPADLSLPPRFDRFRQTQREALDWFQSSDSAVMAAQLATGSGKTLFAAAAAALTGGKATYLVATKALQAQVLRDFEVSGMRDIRGRANYECNAYKNCDDGFDNECSRAQTDACPYTRAVTAAQQSLLPETNYAYWLYSQGVRNKAFEDTQLLICDEAHNIESQLSGFASVKVYAREHDLKLQSDWPISGVMQPETGGSYETPEVGTANWLRMWAVGKIEEIGDSDKDDKDPLSDRCRRIAKMGPNWVWQFDDRGHVTFEPVRLSGFVTRLFAGVPRVLLMSASLSEFTLKLLLPPDLAYEYRAWPPVFPQDHAPVYHIPTVKLNWKSTDEDYKQVIAAADAIMDNRSDRKGIIHTVSYARSRRAIEHSRHRDKFIWNETGSMLSDSLDKFRNSSKGPGTVLVTPSVEEGFDFPASECEYQIVLKFPFPNETQRVIKERCAQIPGYRLHYAAQKIVQMRGRPIRSYHDRAEMFVLDNAVRQLSGPEGRSYLPSGFRIFTVASIPPAPPKLQSSQIREENN
jgi:Rad3-related DNA helicase